MSREQSGIRAQKDEDLGRRLLAQVRERRPRVHCITNLAAGPDVANILLAAGAAPILAQAREEAGEIAAACSAAVLNFGTPDREKLEAIRAAGRRAKEAGVPVIADPVGTGASPWRRERILEILGEIRPDVIHCNFSEALVLLGNPREFHGVDSAQAGLEERLAAAAGTAEKYGCAVLLSGREDVAAGEGMTRVIRGGSQAMGLITGTGCMLSALIGAFCGAQGRESRDLLAGATAASSFWKACGEAAWRQTEEAGGGAGTFHVKLFDAASQMREWREDIEDIGR